MTEYQEVELRLRLRSDLVGPENVQKLNAEPPSLQNYKKLRLMKKRCLLILQIKEKRQIKILET